MLVASPLVSFPWGLGTRLPLPFNFTRTRIIRFVYLYLRIIRACVEEVNQGGIYTALCRFLDSLSNFWLTNEKRYDHNNSGDVFALVSYWSDPKLEWMYNSHATCKALYKHCTNGCDRGQDSWPSKFKSWPMDHTGFVPLTLWLKRNAHAQSAHWR